MKAKFKVVSLLTISIAASAFLVSCADSEKTASRQSSSSSEIPGAQMPSSSNPDLITLGKIPVGDYQLKTVHLTSRSYNNNFAFFSRIDATGDSLPACSPSAETVKKVSKTGVVAQIASNQNFLIDTHFAVSAGGSVDTKVEGVYSVSSSSDWTNPKECETRVYQATKDSEYTGLMGLMSLLSIAKPNVKLIEQELPNGKVAFALKVVSTKELRFYASMRASGAELIAEFVYTRSEQKTEPAAAVPTPAPIDTSYYEPAPYAPSYNQPASAPAQKQIQLTERERNVAQSTGTGIARNANGQLMTFNTPQEVKDYASQNGFSPEAAEDSMQMVSKTGGRVGFAKNADDIKEQTLDMLADMKKRINANTGDLDLVFVIDYSGSMSDDIAAVIGGLDSLVTSLEAVQNAQREVRIGIVTFGSPSREAVELQPSTDFNAVRTKLQTLLSEFRYKQHSTDPGEACYMGIDCAATQIKWNLANRMALVITDEESWEVRSNRQDLVDQAINNLKASSMVTSIYSILTK